MFLLHRTSDLLRKNPPDLRGALAECNAAVREDSSNPEVLRIYGCFLSNVGQRKAAQQQFEAALAVDPTSDVVILSYSELILAGVEDATDDREGRGKSASELQAFLKERSTTRLQHLHHAQHLLERLLEIADTRPEVQAKARQILQRVQAKLQRRDVTSTWSSNGFLDVQARTQLDSNTGQEDRSTELSRLLCAKKKLNADLENISQLEREKVFGRAEAEKQRKEAQSRFEAAKIEFDRVSVNGSDSDVLTAREAGAAGESSDDEEIDAALTRLTGETAAKKEKKRRSFFMCMPIPSL